MGKSGRMADYLIADNHQFLHEAYVSDKLIKDIHKVLRLHRKGIPLNDFVSEFEEVIKCELPVEELGFNSISELLQRVPGVDVSKPPDSTKLMVFCTTPISDSETESDSSERMSAKEKDAMLSNTSSQKRSRSVYTRQAPPSKDVRMCPVYVTHVNTPSSFCVQLIGDKTTKALEALQEDMTAFFSSKDGDAYAIKEPYIGQPCCTIFNNDGYWYRSEVVSITSFDVVEVHYVDYGNSSQVPLASLRRPKAHYLALPAQSINCRLANLKPAGSTWSLMAKQLLFQMTKDKAIVAIVSAIQENCMSVCLCDTNTERDIHINDCLCNQGLAIFNADTLEDQKDFDGYQLESPNLISADKEDVRSPGDLGRIASASLSATTQQSQEPHLPAPPTPVTPTPSNSSQPPSLPFIPSTSLASTLAPSTAAASQQPGGGATPSLPMASAFTGMLPSLSNPQLAQLQYLQLLLLQQNALLAGGAMPILGMQGIANSLVSQAGSGQTSKGTGEAGLETNQATVPPPGFAPPGLTQATAAGQKVPATTEGRDHVTSQASQTGQTSQQLPVTSVATTTASEICVDLNQCEQTSQTSLTTQTGTSSSVAPPTTSAASTSPIQATFEHVNQSSTHPASSSTYPSEVAGIPSDSPEPTAVVVDREPTRAVLSNGGSVRSRISSSSVSSHSDNTSSLSSEGESLQLSRKYGSRGDSCLADSENEAKVKFSSGRSDFVPGEGQLFFSGGAVSPAWAKEKAFIKRVRLTVDYSLCVLRHDDKAYFLSSEVSEWFWECDLLQSMLRQVQKPCWGLIITEKKNKKLFQTLRRVHFTSRFILSRQQITVYALEDLPQILVTFNGSDDLCTAVKEQVEAWQLLRLSYFSRVSTDEIQLLEDTLTELKEKRKGLVELLMNEEDEGQTEEESSLSQLIDVKKKITDLGKRLNKLKRLAASCPHPASVKTTETTSCVSDTRQSSCEPRGDGEDTANTSKLGQTSVSKTVAEVEGHANAPSISQNDSNTPVSVAKVEGHVIAAPKTQRSSGTPDSIVEVKGQEGNLTSTCAGEDEIKVHSTSPTPLQKAEVTGRPCSQDDGLADLTDGEPRVTEVLREDPLETVPQHGAVDEEALGEEAGGWDVISEAEADGEKHSVEATTAEVVVKADASQQDSGVMDLTQGVKEGDKALQVAIPTASKSYSSVASSPPRRSYRGLPLHDPSYQPRMQHRGSPLYPPVAGCHLDNPLAVGPYQFPTHYQHYCQPSTPLMNPVNPHLDFIPPHGSWQRHAALREWPVCGSSQATPTMPQFSGSPPSRSSISGSKPPQATPTYAALAASPPKSSGVACTPPTPTSLQPGSLPKTPVVALLPTPTLLQLGSLPKTSVPALFPTPTSLQPGSLPKTSDAALLPTPSVAQPSGQLPSNTQSPEGAMIQPREVSKSALSTSQTSSRPSVTSALPVSKEVALGGVNQPPKKRPVGIGRGGRPLPPLDTRTGVGYPPMRPMMPPSYLHLPQYNVARHHMPSGQGLLPSPGHPPMTTPIPVAPEERWIYMNHRRHYGYGGKYEEFPPMGSGAGLDII